MDATEDLQRQISVYKAGWAAMDWLARHARNASCPECCAYRRQVDQHGDAYRHVKLRCRQAQQYHRAYMAVEQMRKGLDERFECVLAGIEPGLICAGPADWALAERRGGSRDKGELLSYDIGCRRHVELFEGRAVVRGHARFHIEKLEDVLREGADKMR